MLSSSTASAKPANPLATAKFERPLTGDFALRRKNFPGDTSAAIGIRQRAVIAGVLQRKTGRGVFRGARNFRVIVRVVNSGTRLATSTQGLEKSVDSIRLTVGGSRGPSSRGKHRIDGHEDSAKRKRV